MSHAGGSLLWLYADQRVQFRQWYLPTCQQCLSPPPSPVLHISCLVDSCEDPGHNQIIHPPPHHPENPLKTSSIPSTHWLLGGDEFDTGFSCQQLLRVMAVQVSPQCSTTVTSPRFNFSALVKIINDFISDSNGHIHQLLAT